MAIRDKNSKNINNNNFGLIKNKTIFNNIKEIINLLRQRTKSIFIVFLIKNFIII